MEKDPVKYILMALWAAFYLAGVVNSPFGTDEPRIVLSILLLALSFLAILALNVYAVKTEGRTGSFFRRVGVYWIVYAIEIEAFIRFYIAMRR